MDARMMYDLEENLCKDIEPYAKKGSLTRNDLETVFYLTGAVKNLKKISMMEEEGSSYGMGEWNAMGSYSGRMPMSQNGRYSNRRMSYDGDYNNSGRRNSRDGYNSEADGDMYDRMRMRMEENRM